MDATAFYNGAYFLTDEDLKNNVFTPSGMSITGSGYIAYDSGSLINMLPGKTLAGKTVTIELSNELTTTNTLDSSQFLLFL